MGTSVQSLSSLCHSARRQRQRHHLAPSPVPLLLLPSFPPSCGLSVACPAQPCPSTMVTTTLPSLLLASLSLLAQSTGTTAAPLDLYQRSSFLDPVSRSAPPSTSNNRLEFHFSKRHQQWPRTLEHRQRQLFKRQAVNNATATNSTQVDDQGELLNFEDTRYIATLNLAGQDLDLILDPGSTDTFVYSEQPLPFAGLDPSTLPPLFDNATAVGVVETGLTYEASYGSGNGITQTLGAIELADAEVNGTDLIAH